MTELVIYCLATWRIASLVVNEGGPGSVFVRLREWAGITHDDMGNKLVIPDGFLAGVFSCIWCSSIWIGGGWVLIGWLWPEGGFRLAMVFAFSAGAVFLEKWLRG